MKKLIKIKLLFIPTTIILFIVIFEGRSRYLYNYISIFIIVGTMGVKNILQYLDKKILQIKTKKDKI